MGNYRGRFDIIAAMLQVASKRAKKTQIMYQANLSYGLLVKYLMEARRWGLIHYSRKEHYYTITLRGEEFLQKYGEYSKHSKRVEEQISVVNEKIKALEELCSLDGVGNVGKPEARNEQVLRQPRV